MEIVIHAVVFFHPGKEKYCSYCPETWFSFATGATVEEVIEQILFNADWELKERNIWKNLRNRGWKIDENSVIPPIFSVEEMVKETFRLHAIPITDYKIEELHVTVPAAS